MRTRRIASYLIVLLVSAFVITQGGKLFYRYQTVKIIRSTGLWAIDLYPNYVRMHHSEYPVPEPLLLVIQRLRNHRTSHGNWLHDEETIAAIFEPPKAITFTATETGLKNATRKNSRFRQFETMSIRFYSEETGVISPFAFQTYFNKLDTLKNLTINDLPPELSESGWSWLGQLSNLEDFSLKVDHEIDIDALRAHLPEDCSFSLNGVEFANVWPEL